MQTVSKGIGRMGRDTYHFTPFICCDSQSDAKAIKAYQADLILLASGG
jgi:hypothetical protein